MAGTEMAITAYGISLSLVTYFKYLGIVISAEDDNWTAVFNNLWVARQKYVRMTRVLIRGGADNLA